MAAHTFENKMNPCYRLTGYLENLRFRFIYYNVIKTGQRQAQCTLT